MANTRTFGMVSLFGLVGLAGCGSTPDNGPAVVDAWLGETTHLAVSGNYQDKVFNVHMEGDAAKGVYCHRFYAPMLGVQPDADGHYDSSQVYFAMKELGGVIDLDGKPTEFTISYWRHDVPAGTDLQVIARNYGNPIPDGETWSDINIFEPGADVLSGIESAAATGKVSMKLNTGTPDSNGVMIPPGGRTGEFISVSWGPHDNLNVSATADCTVTVVAPWATALLKP